MQEGTRPAKGCYSLATGFCIRRKPARRLFHHIWRADEKAIYEITELFHQGLAKGMRKDDALRSAKCNSLRSGRQRDTFSPIIEANMILTGNTRIRSG